MAAFGFVTLLVASLLPALCSVVGAPTSPENYSNALARPFTSISNAWHSNHPAEHEPGFSQNDFDPVTDLPSGWQTLSGHSAREQSTMNTAATNPYLQGDASHYSPVMTSNNLGDGASYSRGGAGRTDQHPGFQHQPSASIPPSPAGYRAIEPRLQPQHPSSLGGGDSFDLGNPPEYSEKEIDEMVGLLNSRDFSLSSSLLPNSQERQVDAPSEATVAREPHELGRWQRVALTKAKNKVVGNERRQELLHDAIEATRSDLRSYDYLWSHGDPALDPAWALKKLTLDDLHRHAKVAFDVKRTATQTPLQDANTDAHVVKGWVYSTEHQSAIVQELINRRLQRFAGPNNDVSPIHVTADSTYTLHKSNFNRAIRRLIHKNRDVIQGPFGGPHDGIETTHYNTPFTLGKYEIHFLDTRDKSGPQRVFAFPAAALDGIRGNTDKRRRTMDGYAHATTDGDDGDAPKPEPKGIYLGLVPRG